MLLHISTTVTHTTTPHAYHTIAANTNVNATRQINILRIGRDTQRTYAILMTNCYCLLVRRCP